MSLMSALVSFALVAGLITLTPGLDTALVLRTAARRGRRAGAAASLGIVTGLLVWGVTAAVGVSALLTASETAYTVVRYLGVAYMLWLGLGMLRSALRGGGLAPQTAAVETRGTWTYYRQGLFVNLMNPKVGVFYIALLPQFMSAEVPPALMGVLLALVHVTEGLIWFALLIVAIERMRGLLQRPTAQRAIDGVAGLAVTGFGIRLAFTRT
ncbi:MAG: LysE family translocator [Dermatophilus congolensis]|nr:LysE family translocator [Dermatophilus congolensis]